MMGTLRACAIYNQICLDSGLVRRRMQNRLASGLVRPRSGDTSVLSKRTITGDVLVPPTSQPSFQPKPNDVLAPEEPRSTGLRTSLENFGKKQRTYEFVLQGAPKLLARRILLAVFLVVTILTAPQITSAGSNFEDYEGRLISAIEITFEGSPPDPAAEAEFLSLLTIVPNTEFSAVALRNSLQALFDSERVANARVEVFEAAGQSGSTRGPIRLRFVIQRQVQIGDVKFVITPPEGTPIAEDELRARVNLTQPGTRLTKQVIIRNTDELLVYLRDRGYFNAVVEPSEQLDASGTRATVIYRIVPGEQSRVSTFNIDITGFDASPIRSSLLLQNGAPFTRDALGEDMKRIRQALIDKGFLAPLLEDPRVIRDAERNTITINLIGKVGPMVTVVVPDYPMNEKTARDLLPVKREGNIDISAIIEGSRRLRNKLQEQGYFFAEVTPVCTITPPPPAPEFGENGTAGTCEILNPEALSGRTVEIRYDIERGRRFKLTDIRITGTNKLTLADVEADLRTQ